MDTDAIVPGKYLDHALEEITGIVFESLRPDFASGVSQGDVIVAGRNFGCGSSREQAASVLKLAGISGVVAESFGRIFFRNAIAVGLPALACLGISQAFEEGQRISISLKDGRIVNLDSNQELQAQTLSENMISILEKGGAVAFLQAMVRGET